MSEKHNFHWKRVCEGVTNFDCQGQGLELWKSKSAARVEAPRVRSKKHNSGGKEQSQLSHSHFVDILRNTSAGHQRESARSDLSLASKARRTEAPAEPVALYQLSHL